MIGKRPWLRGAALALGGRAIGWPMGVVPARAADPAGFAGLASAFAAIETRHGGRLGVAVLDTGSGARAGHRQDERFPLGSTYKLLAAAAVLARIEAGQDRADRVIRFGREVLVEYSPVTGPAAGGAGMTLAALCEAAMILSDNTAGNLLMEGLGGPAGLTAWLRRIGDTVTRLDRLETALNEARPGDPRDTTSPAAMLADLRSLALGPALAPPGQAQLQDWLRANRTGDARLRAGLPAGWRAGEKTGTSAHGTSNDVGLLWPPDGAPPVLVAAYLTEGAAEARLRDTALAEVAAAIATALRR